MNYFRFLCSNYPDSVCCLSRYLSNFIFSQNETLSSLCETNSRPCVSKSNTTPPYSACHDSCGDLLFLYCNVRSLLPKVHTLFHYVSIYNPSIVALTETWLDPATPSSFISPPNYTSYRCDRSARRGGGSLILIDNSITSKPLSVNPLNLNIDLHIDCVACELSLVGDVRLGILCVYRPPDSSPSDNVIMFDIINNFLKYNFHYSIILGDFNFPDIVWPFSASSSQNKAFLSFCQENFLVQHVDVSTRIASDAILDLIFSSHESIISGLSVGEEFGSSDHSVIQFSVSIKHNFTRARKRARRMKGVDWSRFQDLLQPSQDWFDALLSKDIDFVWSHFVTSLNHALNEVAPYHLFSARNFISSPKIRTALRHKRRCFQNLCRSPSFPNLALYEKSKIIARDSILKDLRSREERIINNPDQRLFWSYVNNRLTKDNTVRVLSHGGFDIHDSEKIANVFNEYFISTFSTYTTSTSCTMHTALDVETTLSEVTFSPYDIFQLLLSLPPKSSVDADDLSYKILRNGGLPICFGLYYVFSSSLELSCLPSSWKSAIISPIFKSGSKTLVDNYRPISVTSCCSRLLERIVNNKIINFLSVHNKISNTQHGFTSGKSTDTILIKFYDYITHFLDCGMVVDCIFFDFQKAFDTVPHSILLCRLHSIGIRGSVLSWLDDFLTNRSQVVGINRSLSKSLPVTSGVIQGSVLGPTLFNIFVNDLDKSISHCKILKYADDTRIFLAADKSLQSVNNLHRMVQEDIDNVAKWSLDSGLKLNISKCFCCLFWSP